MTETNRNESKDLLSVLWAGADVLRSKMDANEYKTYLLGLIFYKYLSDAYLVKAYDMIEDAEPADLHEALDTYTELYNSEDRDDLLSELKEILHYTLKPEQTYTHFIDLIGQNKFERSMLQDGFNSVEASDELFTGHK